MIPDGLKQGDLVFYFTLSHALTQNLAKSDLAFPADTIVGVDYYIHINLTPKLRAIRQVDADSDLKIRDSVNIDFRQEKMRVLNKQSGKWIN